eukprot:scaffold108932_cov67-Phaeocystis_antarctica.AAC.2
MSRCRRCGSDKARGKHGISAVYRGSRVRMWWSVTERRHRDECRGTVTRVRPVRVQFMSSLQGVQMTLPSGAAVLLNVPLRQPHASEFSAPRPSAVLSNLARLTRKYVGRVAAGATGLARHLACFWLVLSAQALEAFNCRVAWTVRALLTRLATEGVRRVVARSTDHALAAAQKRLVRASRAFKTPGPVSTVWSIGSL